MSGPVKISIIIRTLNEERCLDGLLTAISGQELEGTEVETLIVDSGSTDGTLDIARKHGCRILRIDKHKFSFGRSLNLGCEAAQGDHLVFVSGHCIPVHSRWLKNLVAPLIARAVVWTYGRQQGGERTRFSEERIFRKYFPDVSHVPQEGYYCNNANSALVRNAWLMNPFDEDLTGLEDLHLAKSLWEKKLRIGYVADAPVYHLHNESWAQVRRRFEREAIALRTIMPDVTITPADFLRYFASSVWLDAAEAFRRRKLCSVLPEIIAYRFMQFTGSYRGNHMHKKLTADRKEKYFYPNHVPRWK